MPSSPNASFEQRSTSRGIRLKNASVARAIFFVGMVAMLPACSSHYFGRYRAEISQNQLALQKIELGMSPSTVRAIMGEGEMVRYTRIQLVDPWKNEMFFLEDGTPVVVLYYVTQPPHRYNPPRSGDLTPIVFENDAVVGWGWSFLRQNSDRYRMTLPADS